MNELRRWVETCLDAYCERCLPHREGVPADMQTGDAEHDWPRWKMIPSTTTDAEVDALEAGPARRLEILRGLAKSANTRAR